MGKIQTKQFQILPLSPKLHTAESPIKDLTYYKSIPGICLYCLNKYICTVDQKCIGLSLAQSANYKIEKLKDITDIRTQCIINLSTDKNNYKIGGILLQKLPATIRILVIDKLTETKVGSSRRIKIKSKQVFPSEEAIKKYLDETTAFDEIRPKV